MSQEQIGRAAEAIRNSDAKTRQFMESSKGAFLGIFYGAAKAAKSPPDNAVTFARLPNNGGWGLRGPKSMMIEGEKVTVTKKEGSVAEATVGEFVRDENGNSSLHRKK